MATSSITSSHSGGRKRTGSPTPMYGGLAMTTYAPPKAPRPLVKLDKPSKKSDASNKPKESHPTHTGILSALRGKRGGKQKSEKVKGKEKEDLGSESMLSHKSSVPVTIGSWNSSAVTSQFTDLSIRQDSVNSTPLTRSPGDSVSYVLSADDAPDGSIHPSPSQSSFSATSKQDNRLFLARTPAIPLSAELRPTPPNNRRANTFGVSAEDLHLRPRLDKDGDLEEKLARRSSLGVASIISRASSLAFVSTPHSSPSPISSRPQSPQAFSQQISVQARSSRPQHDRSHSTSSLSTQSSGLDWSRIIRRKRSSPVPEDDEEDGSVHRMPQPKYPIPKPSGLNVDQTALADSRWSMTSRMSPLAFASSSSLDVARPRTTSLQGEDDEDEFDRNESILTSGDENDSSISFAFAGGHNMNASLSRPYHYQRAAQERVVTPPPTPTASLGRSNSFTLKATHPQKRGFGLPHYLPRSRTRPATASSSLNHKGSTFAERADSPEPEVRLRKHILGINDEREEEGVVYLVGGPKTGARQNVPDGDVNYEELSWGSQWRGQWNRGDMQDVIQKLRSLK